MPRPRHQTSCADPAQATTPSSISPGEALLDPLAGISAGATNFPKESPPYLSRQRRPHPSGDPRFESRRGVSSACPRQSSPRLGICPAPVRLAARGPSAPPAAMSGGTLVSHTNREAHPHSRDLASRPFTHERPAVPLPPLRLTSPTSSPPPVFLSPTCPYLYGRDPAKYMTSVAGYTAMFQSLLSETGHI